MKHHSTNTIDVTYFVINMLDTYYSEILTTSANNWYQSLNTAGIKTSFF